MFGQTFSVSDVIYKDFLFAALIFLSYIIKGMSMIHHKTSIALNSNALFSQLLNKAIMKDRVMQRAII